MFWGPNLWELVQWSTVERYHIRVGKSNVGWGGKLQKEWYVVFAGLWSRSSAVEWGCAGGDQGGQQWRRLGVGCWVVRCGWWPYRGNWVGY